MCRLRRLGETIGWRMSFMATAALGIVSMLSLFFSLPKGGAGERPEVRKELAVLMRPQVLSALLTTVLGGRGDVHALYLYFTGSANHYRCDTRLYYGNVGADWRWVLHRQLSWR